MLPGDIALVRPNGWVGEGIDVVSRSRYCHVRLIRGSDGSTIEANPPGAFRGTVQKGDVIVSVNQEPVTTPKEAVAKLKAAQSSQDKSVLLQINRHGVNAFVAWSSEQSDNG